ncbi:phosphohydrolase [Nonlabens sp. YIK11]|uniref:HD domain-containing protein n=1 Tax=Nonlabens sp. YIK11 TaxID=1453349 RepID=UPI0006DC137E|nr:HD domain-containing protein [Nonlabens sp. YIK11]KQC34603.1 phosphohydrolase [Nonlabens sp. YIK11]
MKQQNKLKILNDPIYGFISVPNNEIFELIEHPYFQRLRRITQMGLSYLVYPGANHTRFHHAIGCMHLMQKAVQVLRSKSVSISEVEEDALYKAILLHDLGHGPFSHALENLIVPGRHHEELSLLFMEDLNRQFNGSLTTAIQIFKGEYDRPFMLELVSSQLDMDRLDYLRRDSFYTGVAEGNINSQRLIAMLNVKDDRLVVEEKALYSVESFLSNRRLMYWQVYLHKTGIGAEHLLQSVFKRIAELMQRDIVVETPQTLRYFLKNEITAPKDLLEAFAMIDDSDVIQLLKMNMNSADFVLSELCKMIINRQLLKIKIVDKPVSTNKLKSKIEKLKKSYNLTSEEAGYFIFNGTISVSAYAKANPILILNKKGKLEELTDATNEQSFEALTKVVTKYYYCYPKIQD